MGSSLGIQRLVVAVPLLFHDLLGEVHVDQALVDLDDAVLKPGGNPQFARLGGQDQVGLDVLGDADAVEGHQGPQARRDDGAGAGQAHAVRNIRAVPDREVLVVQLDLVFLAVVVELLDRGLQEADAAIVAVQPHVLHQARDAVEAGAVLLAGQDLQLRRLVQDDLRAEIAEGEGDRLAEVSIRGIAHQPALG